MRTCFLEIQLAHINHIHIAPCTRRRRLSMVNTVGMTSCDVHRDVTGTQSRLGAHFGRKEAAERRSSPKVACKYEE